MRRSWLLAFGLFIAVLLMAQARLHDRGILRALDQAGFDLALRLRAAPVPGGEVAILVIDDMSLQQLGQWPPPRAALAAAIEALTEAGASVVALDLLLLEETSGGDVEASHRLVTALRRHPRPVLAMAFAFAEPVPVALADRLALDQSAFSIVRAPADAIDLLGQPTGVFLPFRPLAETARLGHVNVFVEPRGELRFIQPAIRFGEAWYPALAVRAAALHRGLPPEAMALDAGRALRLGETTAPLDAASRLVINPYGPAGTFPHLPLADLLDGTLDPGLFAGRIVLIGATATGVRDHFATALDPRVPGVEIIATVIDNLLTGRFIDRSARIRDLDLALIAVTGLVGLVLLAPLPAWTVALLAPLVLALPFALAAAALVLLGLWLDPVLATFGALVMVLAAIATSLRRLRRQSEAHAARSDAFARYVPPLLRDDPALADGVERSQLAAILFCDLEGFTSAAETHDADRLQPLLQRLYALIDEKAAAHGAVVAGYAGDGAMLIFGLPEPGPDDAANAIACGEALIAAMPFWQEEAEAAGLPPLPLRVGINYGRARIGHVGGRGGGQIQFTANGDVVNVASRLQGATRGRDTAMIVSATTVEAARAQSGDRAVAMLAPLPPLQLKGRAVPVPAYAWREGQEEKRRMRGR